MKLIVYNNDPDALSKFKNENIIDVNKSDNDFLDNS